MLPFTYLIGVLMVEISPFFSIPFFVLFLISSIGLMSLECGNCGDPLLYRAKQALGVSVIGRPLGSQTVSRAPAMTLGSITEGIAVGTGELAGSNRCGCDK